MSWNEFGRVFDWSRELSYFFCCRLSPLNMTPQHIPQSRQRFCDIFYSED